MASRGEHLLVQQNIIPSDVRLISNLTDERNQYLATQEIAQYRQENGVMVSKIWRSMGTKSPVTPAHVIISSTNLRISSIKLLTINYKLSTNAHGWQSKVHTLSAKCLALLPCMIPLLMMAKQSS